MSVPRPIAVAAGLLSAMLVASGCSSWRCHSEQTCAPACGGQCGDGCGHEAHGHCGCPPGTCGSHADVDDDDAGGELLASAVKAPLGTISDPIWQQQEANAEASDFVIHEHEFVGNTVRLNAAGEQHVRQIAARGRTAPFPILVEPSSMSYRPGTQSGFPVHNDPQLDLARRQLIVQILSSMGMPNAEQRVVVSPALTPGFESFEAERAYYRGLSPSNGAGFGGFGGFGGFNGGFGFGGGIGGVGGF